MDPQHGRVLTLAGRVSFVVVACVALLVAWSLGWMAGGAVAIGAFTGVVLALWAGEFAVRSWRTKDAAASARAAARIVAPAAILGLLLPAWSFLGPVVARAHSEAARRSLESEYPRLAWYSRVERPREANWVAARLRGLASAPDAESVEEVTRVLLAGDPIVWDHESRRNGEPEALHARLLADAEAHVAAARFDVAERRLLADWRLARSLLSSLGAGLSRFAFAFAVDAAVALRRLPSIDADWSERLTPGAWRERTGDYLVILAVDQFRFAEDVAGVSKRAGARRLALDWLWHPLESRHCVEEARALLQLSAIVRDAERCGEAWSQPETPVSGTARSSLPRRLDALTAQLELTRKVAQAKRLRAADGRYPDAIDGFDASECEGLAWSYEGGTRLSITATGDAAAWYAGEKGWPQLEHREP